LSEPEVHLRTRHPFEALSADQGQVQRSAVGIGVVDAVARRDRLPLAIPAGGAGWGPTYRVNRGRKRPRARRSPKKLMKAVAARLADSGRNEIHPLKSWNARNCGNEMQMGSKTHIPPAGTGFATVDPLLRERSLRPWKIRVRTRSSRDGRPHGVSGFVSASRSALGRRAGGQGRLGSAPPI
jgi:hypothetical protein